MDRIVLKNMGFYGYHGNLQSEKELGQRFFVDVVVHTDVSKAGVSDNLEDSINYVEIYERVKAIVEGPSRNLLECVSSTIADELMASYATIAGVEVTVRKPEVPIPGLLDCVEVTAVRGEV